MDLLRNDQMPNAKYQVRRWIHWILSLSVLLVWENASAATLATFRTTLGTMEVEFYDEDKPVTVSNFVKYVTSGRFTNEFVQRWAPGFVIQGGGYAVTNTPNGLDLTPIEPFGTITNEYSVGRPFSNTYGTIAMAR